MADVTLDVKGLTCPLPVLKTKKVMRDVPKGGTLEVLATDPGSVADFEATSAKRKIAGIQDPGPAAGARGRQLIERRHKW